MVLFAIVRQGVEARVAILNASLLRRTTFSRVVLPPATLFLRVVNFPNCIIEADASLPEFSRASRLEFCLASTLP